MKKKKRQETTEAYLEINVTPLADVALVLVIILMLLTPAAIQSMIKVQSTRLGSSTPKPQAQALSIQVKLQGLFLNGRPVPSLINLQQQLKAQFTVAQDRSIYVMADQTVLHGQVVAVLDTVKQSGGEKISLVRSAK